MKELRICEECGKEFTAIRKDQYFCSKACYHRHYNRGYQKPKKGAVDYDPLREAILEQAIKDLGSKDDQARGSAERFFQKEDSPFGTLFPDADPDHVMRLAKEKYECVTQTTPSGTSSDGTEDRNEPSNDCLSANAAESTSSKTTPSESETTGTVTTASTGCANTSTRRNGMKDFEEVYAWNVWDQLKAGKEVKAVDLGEGQIHELLDCSVGEVVTILGYDNVICFMRKEEEKE